MKAFRKQNGIIVIRKNTDDYETIKEMVSKLSKDLASLRAVCEDRNTEIFPVELIKGIIARCEDIKDLGDGIYVTEEFLKVIRETKNALGYFEERIDKVEYEERLLTRKKECFQIFLERLKQMETEHFQRK